MGQLWRSHELTMKDASPEIAIHKYLFVLYCIVLLTAEGGSLENIKKKNAASIKLPVLRIDFNSFALLFTISFTIAIIIIH